MNIAKMMKQAQKMQSEMKKVQAEVQKMEKTFSVAGAIEVTARGDGHITSVKLNPAAVDPDDIEGLEDLIVTAVNSAVDDIQKESQEKMSAVTGGMGDLGGLTGMM